MKQKPLFIRIAGYAALTLMVYSQNSFSQKTRYVSPAGNDSDSGTVGRPFATLQKAVGLANPGDTIYMRGGTYHFTAQVWIDRSGGSGNRIHVLNYPGELPVLDGNALPSASPYHAVITLRANTGWWHFKGLEVSYGPAHGFLLVGSSNNIIERCILHHNTRLQLSGGGIMLDGGSSDNLLLNNDSHHNGVYGSTGGDGIGVTGLPASGNIVRGNRSWRNNDDGIDLWDAKGVLVENNWSWENGKKDDLTPTGGNGVGFKLGGAGAGDGDHTIRNNLAWKNISNGFDANSADLPVNVLNNTAWENGGSNFHFNNGIVAYVLKNNLAFTPNSASMGASTLHSFNSWNLPVTVNSADFASLDFTGAAGPRNADGSLPSTGFLKLAPGSDCIDKGADVGIAFNGISPDLGAYESTAGGAAEFNGRPFAGSSLSADPNPFSSAITFRVASGKTARLSLYDVSGRKIAVFEGHEWRWEVRDNPAAIYLVRACIDGRLTEKRVLLVR